MNSLEMLLKLPFWDCVGFWVKHTAAFFVALLLWLFFLFVVLVVFYLIFGIDIAQ